MDERRFHLINLGLPKTGSTTLAHMFRDYRSAHEWWHARSVDALLDRATGRRSEDELDAFLLVRDRSQDLEVDAATFLHLAADRIPHVFPEARFVIVIRPCTEWAASFLGMLMDALGPGGWGAGLPRQWVERYAAHVSPTLADVDLGSRLAIAAARHELADELADYWRRRTMAAVSHAPSDRTLIVDLASLSGAGPALSRLLDVPVDTIRQGERRNRGRMIDDARHLLGQALADAATTSQMEVMAAVDDAEAARHGPAELGASPTMVEEESRPAMHAPRSLPDEDELLRRCDGNGLVALLLLLDADDVLRSAFEADPAAVLADFGLGRPADLLGRRGLACPVMPDLPGGSADDEIADPYWRGWLRGGVAQVEPYRAGLSTRGRLPRRSDLSTIEWQVLAARVRTVIARTLDEARG